MHRTGNVPESTGRCALPEASVDPYGYNPHGDVAHFRRRSFGSMKTLVRARSSVG
jgi:hypothetical protein